MKERVSKMKFDQRALVSQIQTLRLTIADMSQKEKHLVEKILMDKAKNDAANTIRLAKVRELLEVEEVASLVEEASPTTNMERLSDIIALIKEIQTDIKNSEISEDIYSKYNGNNDRLINELGWKDGMNGTVWASQASDSLEKNLAHDDQLFALEEVEEVISPVQLSEEINKIIIDDENDEIPTGDSVSPELILYLLKGHIIPTTNANQ